MAFRLLALAVPDPVKTEIKITCPERDIMECTLNEDMILALTGQFKQLSHEPEKFG